MAKIKKHLFSFRVKGQLEHLSTDIHYDSGCFFIDIPEDLIETVKMLEEQWKDLGITLRRLRGGVIKHVIYSDLEVSLINKVPSTLVKIKELQTTTREVIVIYFDDTVQFGSGPTVTKSFIGYKIAYLYCHEVSTSEGTEKRYFKEQLIGGKRQEYAVDIGYHFKGVILADTPENRKTIESLYSKTQNLIEFLKELCNSEDRFLELAAQSNKLLQ
jgi:hypothetical protein